MYTKYQISRILDYSSSYAISASYAANGGGGPSVSASYATTSSYAVTASYALNGGGSSSAFPYVGNASITGNLSITGSTFSTLGFTGSLLGTSSWALNSISSSYSLTSSYSLNGGTTINNYGDDRILTSTTSSNILNAESDFTYNDSTGSVILKGSSPTFVVSSSLNKSIIYSDYIEASSSLAYSYLSPDTIEINAEQGSVVSQLFTSLGGTPQEASQVLGFYKLSDYFEIGLNSTQSYISAYHSGGLPTIVFQASSSWTDGKVTFTTPISASQGITGSLFGTSSWARNSLTASYYEGNIVSSSYAATASYVLTSSYALTASYALSSPRQFYSSNIGDGSTLNIGVTHNLNTRDIIIQLYDNATYETVYCDVIRTNVNFITCSFTVAPTSNQYRIVISS